MLPLLRFERHAPTRWTVSHEACEVGSVVPGRIMVTGFPDRSSAAVAADIATRVLRRWFVRAMEPTAHDQATVALTTDAHGFTCTVPDDLWHARLLELAHRIYAATLSIRYPDPEPAA